MEELTPELAALLGRDDVWSDLPAELEDAIVGAITAEAAAAAPDRAPAGPPARPDADVVDLSARRRPWTAVLAAAAAVVLLVAGFVVGTNVGDDGGEDQLASDVNLALTATDLAPGASADVGITATPLGTRIILDVRDVPPAPEGSYYEAWMRIDAETGVSAGTFHLRGGDGQIELWSGVSVEDYPLFTITIQEEGAGAVSSGRVILRGLVDG